MSLEDYLFEELSGAQLNPSASSPASVDTASQELDAALQRLALPQLRITTVVNDKRERERGKV